MDIYGFINSKAIAAHCRQIGHQFTPVEMAYLIHESENHTIPEKHAAFRKLIETTPDTEVKERPWTPHFDSLHDFLKQYMQIENKFISLFYEDESGCIYSFKYLVNGDSTYVEDENIYPDFHSCYGRINAEIDDRTEIIDLRVTKQWLNHGDEDYPHKLVLCITCDNIPVTLFEVRGCMETSENEIYTAFDGLWLDVPTPFEAGDILVAKSKYIIAPEPFVVTNIANRSEHAERWAQSGDNTDMIAWGYFQESDNGDIYSDCMHDYFTLEYYHGELTGIRRVLKALSSYMKGEIDLSLYSRAYRTILTEENAKALYPIDITDDGLILAGLKD